MQDLFSQYFDAINTRNYAQYVSTQASGASQGQSSFESGYESTVDSNEVVNSITSNGDGTLTAGVSFTSHQNAADSWDQSSTCNNWTLSLILVPQGSGYVMSTEVSHTVGDCQRRPADRASALVVGNTPAPCNARGPGQD